MKFISTILILLSLNSIADQKQLNELFKKIPNIKRAELNDNFQKLTRIIMDKFNTGDIVGNGGGAVEQNFNFAFNSIPTVVNQCLSSMECLLSNDEKLILLEIRSTFFSKLDQRTRFIFINEDESRGIFKDQFDKTERIAKTGFSNMFPIFINLGLIEKSKYFKYDPSAALSLIIHELGHQAGYASHSMLDNLSSKLRVAFSYSVENTKIDIAGKELLVNIYNSEFRYDSQISFTYNYRLTNLSYEIRESLQCETKRQFVSGYSLSNAYWERATVINDRTHTKLSLWINIHCESMTGEIWTTERDLEISFIIDPKNKLVENYTFLIQ